MSYSAPGTRTPSRLPAPDRPPLTFGDLRRQVVETVAALNALGFGRGDAVSIVLPNGPEMATSFLSVASGCTSAPLNPAYKEDEFAFYLADLNAKALIVEAGQPSPAIEVAADAEHPGPRLSGRSSGPAGRFTCAAPTAPTSHRWRQPDFAQPDDIALVLHTSGTTSRPKQVPLASATWRLGPAHQPDARPHGRTTAA